MSEQWVVVRYRDQGGVLHEIELCLGAVVELPGSALSARLATDREGTTRLQKWVPEDAGSREPSCYDLLDADIRAGARLAQVFPGTPYPAELPTLFGYNVDVAEPFVLWEAYRGEPAARAIRRLEPAAQQQFRLGLLRALLHTAAAGVVHGAVGLPALRWDPAVRTVQLVDFEQAGRQGEPRRPGGAMPARSREQVQGIGIADARDDVWGAGLVIRELELGPRANTELAALTGGSVQLQYLLNGVFADAAIARPNPTELLARLNVAGMVMIAPDMDTVLQPSREMFDKIITHKRAQTARPHQPESAAPPATRRATRIPPPAARRATRIPLRTLLIAALVVFPLAAGLWLLLAGVI